ESTPSNSCVVSKLSNNAVRNVVRATFDNFVPLCRNGENPEVTNKCVTIQNLSALNSASSLHVATAYRDVIPKCSSGTSSTCVKTKLPFTCSVSANGCEDGFRVVYAVKTSQSIPSGYFMDKTDDGEIYPDCGSGATGACQ